MYQLTLNMSDNAYTHLKYMVENIPDIEIKEETHKISDDDFKINIDECLKTLKQIKSRNTKDFKAINDVDEHIKELINNIS